MESIINLSPVEYGYGIITARVLLGIGTSPALRLAEEEEVFERSPLKELKIYPNPSNGLLYIEIAENKNVQVQLFDLSGKLILAQNITNTAKHQEIDISNVTNGVYIIHVTNGNESLHGKLVLIK